MTDLNNLSGLGSSTLFLITVFSLVFPFTRWSIGFRCLILVLWACSVLIPFGPVSVSAFARSFIGDLSIPSLVVLLLLVIERVFNAAKVQRREMDRFCLLLLPVALVFYPLSMGLGKYDPYLLGYGSWYLLGFILLITLVALAYDQRLIVLSLCLSVLCHALGWYESNNLWDYLFDPLLVVYATGLAIFRLVSGSGLLYRRCAKSSPAKNT